MPRLVRKRPRGAMFVLVGAFILLLVFLAVAIAEEQFLYSIPIFLLLMALGIALLRRSTA